ncbi:MAG: N-acetylneuraminate synthase [Deltaproteobacteria bacterium]|nr:N-acetylneuraminate synthase [Deltaproteobacteria bacterium]
MRRVKIGDRYVGDEAPVFIIAEAGVNHNGDVQLAKRLVDVAVDAGVDAVKFQTFNAERVVSATAPKAEYQLQTTNRAESQLDMLRSLELSPDAHYEIQAYCRERNILFISTACDRESVDLLGQLEVPVFKIASAEIPNWPLLEYVARKGKPIILSTGMSYLSEVDEAVRVIRNGGCDQLILLHCVSNYPADLADVNLRAMHTMATVFKVPVGYSDHTPGIEVPLAAVAMGACVIEKHLTLDKDLPGPDHRASLEPGELAAMVSGIRAVELALGQGTKAPAPCESGNRSIMRRSLAAAFDLPKGTIIEANMLEALRPAGCISPNLLEHIVGRTLQRAVRSGELIAWTDLQ